MVVLLEDIVKSVEQLLKLTSKKIKEQSYVDPNLDPVLLVPGIAGSILNSVNDKTGKKERIWVRILAADHEFREKLWSKFDPATGRVVTLDLDTHIEVPEDRYGLYAIDTLDPDMKLESFPPVEAASVFMEALSINKINYEGADISLTFNVEILKWANKTRELLSFAEVPDHIKFYYIYGTNYETPHSVCYGSEDAPVSDLRQLPTLQYLCM